MSHYVAIAMVPVYHIIIILGYYATELVTTQIQMHVHNEVSDNINIYSISGVIH